MTITLNGSDLTVTQVVAASRMARPSPWRRAIAARRQARAVVTDVLASASRCTA